MLMSYKMQPEKWSIVPAPTHVDGVGRLQTINKEQTPLYWRLIKELENPTAIPVALDISFNENEPVVCTPIEALDCFLRAKMDVPVMDNFLVETTIQLA